ncbi:hypothetical protein TNCV_3737311 [Trichonephila clavipes]|nr:hypothetical protein TNCV_3737311 [Trichonephila clavipes]
MTPELAPSPNFNIKLMRGRLSLDIFNEHRPFLHDGSSEVHEQMPRSGGQSEARPPVPKQVGTHLWTYCSQSTLPSPEIEPGPVVWKRGTLPLDA